MNARERFLRTMRFQPVDRVPYCELGMWGQTVERWWEEGMPRDVDTQFSVRGNEYFGLDRRVYVDINMAICPLYDEETLEENERYIVYISTEGVKRRALKEGTSRGTRPSMDTYLDFPVKNRDDFLAIKKRYDPRSPARYPLWWDDLVRCYKDRDYPLGLGPGVTFGFYSGLRRWMGTENACTIFYDDPALAHEMLDFLADFFLETVHQALHDLDIDFFNFFEDMAFKTGPLVSPKIFREFLLPRYKKVIDFLRSHGVNVFMVDSDGNIEVLIPMFLEAGVTYIWPIEVAAGMDAVALRKRYGRDLVLAGGLDKREFTRDKKAIDDELLRQVPWLLEQGGYLPHLDHSFPPDIPYENFLYYMDLRRKLAEGRYGV